MGVRGSFFFSFFFFCVVLLFFVFLKARGERQRTHYTLTKIGRSMKEYNNPTVLNYWKNTIRSKGGSVAGLKASGVARLVSKMLGEEQELGKVSGYHYMREKMIQNLSKKQEISVDTKEGCVYFIGNLEHKWVKIGFTINLSKRLIAIQTGSPCLLEILGYIKTKDARKLERQMHGKFSRYKMHGEWYVLSKDIMEFIQYETIKL